MDHQQISRYIARKAGVLCRYPFDPQLPVWFVGSKMFALLGHTRGVESINLKGDPEQNWLLREQYPEAILPGYHMNKRHWNTIVLGGAVPDQLLAECIDESYMLVWRGLPKAQREQI